MITRVVFPQLEAGLEKGTLVAWLAAPGDAVVAGRPIFEVTTDKADFTVDAPTSGKLLVIVAQDGAEISVLETVGLIGNDGDDPAAELAKIAAERTTGTPRNTGQVEPIAGSRPPVGPGAVVRATPRARALAQERGIDLAAIAVQKAGGVIVAADLPGCAGSVEYPPSERVELAPVELGAARALAGQAAKVVPSFVERVAHVAGFRDAAARLTKKTGTMTTPLDTIVFAVSRALGDFPRLNARFDVDCVRVYRRVNIGFAVEHNGTLFVPVIADADRMELREIATATKALRMKIARRRLLPSDVSGATFTVTDLGAAGVERFMPLIGPGQSGILGVGVIAHRPFADENSVLAAVESMPLTLTFDHQAVTGAAAGRFLLNVEKRIKELIDE